MNLVLDPLERQLQRAIRDAVGDGATPPAAWSALVELGAIRFGVPTSSGGFDLGQGAVALVCEELGRALLESPYLDMMLGADCLVAVGGEDGQKARLRAIADGDLAVAAADLASYSGGGSAVTVEERAGRWVAVGDAGPVANGGAPAVLLALALESGPALFLVPTGSRGVRVRPARLGARVELHDVVLDADDLLARGGAAERAFAYALERARVRQAAYLVGLAAGAVDEAVAYARTRRQFGRAIVEFQAVALRLASLLGLLDAARISVRHAAQLQDGKSDARLAATQALALATELALDATREAMHVHGAYGMTEAAPVSRFYRRAAVEAARGHPTAELWCEAGRWRTEAKREGGATGWTPRPRPIARSTGSS